MRIQTVRLSKIGGSISGYRAETSEVSRIVGYSAPDARSCNADRGRSFSAGRSTGRSTEHECALQPRLHQSVNFLTSPDRLSSIVVLYAELPASKISREPTFRLHSSNCTPNMQHTSSRSCARYLSSTALAWNAPPLTQTLPYSAFPYLCAETPPLEKRQ